MTVSLSRPNVLYLLYLDYGLAWPYPIDSLQCSTDYCSANLIYRGRDFQGSLDTPLVVVQTHIYVSDSPGLLEFPELQSFS